MTTTTELTEASKNLFLAYAKDAGNWNGMPMVGGNGQQCWWNVGRKSDAGNLTDLRQNGMVKTFRDNGCDFIRFTDTGKAFAKENGIDLSWIH
jgi:hypothetical protein